MDLRVTKKLLAQNGLLVLVKCSLLKENAYVQQLIKQVRKY